MEKVLFVDDETAILNLIQRTLKDKFDIHVAGSAEEGLSQIRDNGVFPVVVADYQMPSVDGASFLAEISRISPDSVRMMLTGHADFETCVRAVNEGNIFRFLTKPCPTDVIEKFIHEGLRQYRLARMEREYRTLKQWTKSLGGLIEAFIRLIASKDPYTAGHQIRVSQLSAAIARSLDFPGEAVEHITMAAMIHDVGKIYVPAEFLNKPGLLSPSEMNIVKMHPEIGHDILQPINFSFPIHKIILQHHERLDGSGYPLGLKESDLLTESKIIAVADMLEATSHHRPYRPAKGLDQAIDELRDERGVKHDRRIADAAISLLSGGKFQFEET
ncbi:MAG: HD domain-containing protein [Acidobacteria bacterium]|nr:HD domain-containing protein [Acidobacteriota bacterium]